MDHLLHECAQRAPGDGACLLARWLCMRRLTAAGDTHSPSFTRVALECAMGTEFPTGEVETIGEFVRRLRGDRDGDSVARQQLFEIARRGHPIRSVSEYRAIQPDTPDPRVDGVYAYDLVRCRRLTATTHPVELCDMHVLGWSAAHDSVSEARLDRSIHHVAGDSHLGNYFAR